MINGKKIIYLDILSYFFISTPIVITWSTAFILLNYSFYLAPLIPILMIITMSMSLLILRVLLPPLKKGVYKVDININYISWFLNLCLYRSLKASGLETFIRSMNWSRYIIFRSLGMNIHYKTNFALNAEIIDYSSLTIEEGCFISDRAKVSAHYLTPEKLIIRPVTLKKDSYVHPHTTIKPGTKSNEGQVFTPENSGEGR